MSYVNRKVRTFMDRGDWNPERRRSEGRLKTYESAEDLRAWCDDVEQRRQHILELVYKGYAKCRASLIPLDKLIDFLTADKDKDVTNCQKYIDELLSFINSLDLSPEELERLNRLRQKMGQKGSPVKAKSPCPAKKRHDAEKKAVTDLVNSYKVTTMGPARTKIKVKGIQPGFETQPIVYTRAGQIVTRAQSPTGARSEVINAYPGTSATHPGASAKYPSTSATHPGTSATQPGDEVHDAGRPGTPSRPFEAQAGPGGYQPKVAVIADTTTTPYGGPQQKPPCTTCYDQDGRPKSPAFPGTTSQVPCVCYERGGKPFDYQLSPGAERPTSPSRSAMKPSASKTPGMPPSETLGTSITPTVSFGPGGTDALSGPDMVGAKPFGTSIGQHSFGPEGTTPKTVEAQSFATSTGRMTPQATSTQVGAELTEAPSYGVSIAEPDGILSTIGTTTSREVRSVGEAGTQGIASSGAGPDTSLVGAGTSMSQDGRPLIATGTQGGIASLAVGPDLVQGVGTTTSQIGDGQKSAVPFDFSQLPAGDLDAQISMLKETVMAKDATIKDLLDQINAIKAGGIGDTSACQDEIDALEKEMEAIRGGNLPPEQEAEIIKKEVEMLKRYCMKLKHLETEGGASKIEGGDSKEVEEIIKERDELAKKVLELQEELANVRSDDKDELLDKVLAERDELRKKLDSMEAAQKNVEALRKKSAKADELEKQLRNVSKSDKTAAYELQKAKSKCNCLEQELRNCCMEKEAMCKRITYMKSELESLKMKAKECEMLRLERDRLQIKLNELSHVQVHNENLMLKCKCLEKAAGERDFYKQRYEDHMNMECTCDSSQDAKLVARERDALVRQVGDLESCIKDQEKEIQRCMCQIEALNRNKDDTQTRMKEALATMRKEVEKKDQLIAAAEEKLACLQAQLKSSIQGVSCETACYKTRIEELERELCHAQCKMQRLEERLKGNESNMYGVKMMNRNERDSIAVMSKELEAARAENRKLQEIANKMISITGDEHVQKMLKQSECAVKRVVEELGKQYREWDSMRQRNQKSKMGSTTKCVCKAGQVETRDYSDSDSELGCLEEVRKQIEWMEQQARRLQNDCPQKEMAMLKLENLKLKEQLLMYKMGMK